MRKLFVSFFGASSMILLLPGWNSLTINNDPSYVRTKTGDADLDRAVEICDRHKVQSQFVYPEGGAPLMFQPGWDGCHSVISAWGKSEAAKIEREQKVKEEEDHIFVNDYSKKLK